MPMLGAILTPHPPVLLSEVGRGKELEIDATDRAMHAAAEEVARFTGIPKHMLQTGKESYDSNAQQRQNYVTDTLLPYVVQWEQEDGYKAIPPDKRDGEGWYMRGNVAVLLRGDDLTRSQVYERMIRTSVYNPDECRAMEEKAPIPGGLGQQFLATKNLASLEAVLKGEK